MKQWMSKPALDENTFYLDGALEDAAVVTNDYLFNNIRALVDAVNSRGRETTEPITVYMAPHVYWIDDPDATDTVQCQEGDRLPFGLKVSCDTLHLIGLGESSYDVVLAGNRGQSHGANGNYTMFCFKVRDLELSNLTIGNYCSIDLIYPLKPYLNRARRTHANTQAQLAWQQGDKLWARNCNFVSRLNLMPVCGGERCLYEGCHFESTDDALNGRAVYLNCDFDFYGNRPFYCTGESGAVFLDCVFRTHMRVGGVEKTQYFTKEGGQVTVVDCECDSPHVAWTKYPASSLKCYQSKVWCLGEPVIIGGDGASETVLMEGKEIEAAYRLEVEGKSVYNTYNLLRGRDDWDPMGVKDMVLEAGKEAIPTRLTIKASGEEIICGEKAVMLKAAAYYFHGEQAADTEVVFSVDAEGGALVRLTDKGDGSCLVESIKEDALSGKVIVHAVTPQGLEAAVELTISPCLLEAPAFVEPPKVELGAGAAKVNYKLALQGYEERTEITWYRCKDADGSAAVPVAVSRNNMILQEYPLTKEDAGYYLLAEVIPCHVRSRKGGAVCAIAEKAVELEAADWAEQSVGGQNADGYAYVTDFSTMPTVKQEQIIPGFWTVDCYRPKDTAHFGKWETECADREPWKYGETGNGSIGKGLYQNVQGARLMYTPLEGCYGDMTLRVKLDPAKTAGQGFGSAGQYLDLCLKFDTKTLTGYGVRILRSGEASDGVRFLLVEYKEGDTSYLNEGILTSCFLTGCEVCLSVKGNVLSVHAESEIIKAGNGPVKYAPFVDMEVEIAGNAFGGVAIQHTGTPGTGGWQNTTMLHSIEVKMQKVICKK